MTRRNGSYEAIRSLIGSHEQGATKAELIEQMGLTTPSEKKRLGVALAKLRRAGRIESRQYKEGLRFFTREPRDLPPCESKALTVIEPAPVASEEPEDLAEVPCPLCLHPMSDEAIARLIRTGEYRMEPAGEEGE